jgi:hypothetical protein
VKYLFSLVAATALAAAFLGVLLGACESSPEEPIVLRLLDLAPDAESSWPREKIRRLPKKIEGLRNFNKLRSIKVGQVSMLPEGGGDSRRSLVAPSGTRHRFLVRLPENARMRLGLGYMPAPEVEGAGVRFIVHVEPPSRRPTETPELALEGEGGETLVDRLVTVDANGDWLDLDVDLSRWSGQEVELSLMTRRRDADAQVWAAWSAPEIMSREGVESGLDVILISLDTLRADRLGCYGYPLNTSPNLDRLASRGVRFESAVSQAPWTYPSHLALFSGLYFTSLDIKEAPTLAEVLRAEGYRTEALTGGGQMDFRMGFAKGFDTYRLSDWIRELPMLERWLERSSQRRRFLFLHTYEIHDPYVHTEFAEGKDGGRAQGRFGKRKFWGLRGTMTATERDYVSSLYDGGIAYTDGQLGELFGMLDRTGALERSVVIVTSDHGEQFWEHGTWRHGMSLHDHQLLVPLIVHLPESLKAKLGSVGELTGRTIASQVRLIDLYPTILDLLEIQGDRPIHGRSLRPLLEGRDLDPVDAYAERLNLEHRESKALRTERFKYIYSYPKPIGIEQGDKERWELYDLARDPAEQTNLAERYPDEVSRLHARLLSLLKGLRDSEDLPDQPEEEMDPDLEQRLRALGYLD